MVKKSAKKTTRVSRRPVLIILALSLVLAISFAVYKTYFAPQPIQIMAIDPIPLAYGNTTLSGGLHQGDNNSFVLILPDRRIVTLNVHDLEHLDGMPVTVTGNLSSPTDPTQPLSMNVQSLTVIQE